MALYTDDVRRVGPFLARYHSHRLMNVFVIFTPLPIHVELLPSRTIPSPQDQFRNFP